MKNAIKTYERDLDTLTELMVAKPKGQLLRPAMIRRETVRNNPSTLFVFGDNMCQVGLGGQAAEMRHEPNSFGVPTKWSPGMSEDCFFNDDVVNDTRVRARIRMAFSYMTIWLIKVGDVAIPADGLGTGLSQLQTRAPKLLNLIEGMTDALCLVGSRYGEDRGTVHSWLVEMMQVGEDEESGG